MENGLRLQNGGCWSSNLLVSPLAQYSSLTAPQQRDFILPTHADYVIEQIEIYISG
jgi:hypothetical protein